jgi:hypothetical protein
VIQREPGVVKKIKNNEAYYEIHWSTLAKVDKYEITRKVPSEAGIYELYYKDPKGKLILFKLARAWYGGLRSVIRSKTDPILEENASRRKILESHTCYYRYALTFSYNDMTDILSYYRSAYFPKLHAYEDSGRYEEIYVKETSVDKIVDI